MSRRYDFFKFLELELRQILIKEGKELKKLSRFEEVFVKPYDFLAIGDKNLGGIVC